MARLGFVLCTKKPHSGWFSNAWKPRECAEFVPGDPNLVPERVVYFEKLNKRP